ncbi:MAG TPA: alpha/beta hydrolase, partial [Acidimicrobiales bacterium]|nr:alpha/beta hydrolase [Acidimicrobiales bacterium]
ADAGFHAVAPALRGYAPTDVPDDGLYQTGALAADANALHEVLGGDERAVVVGHDWGALAAYGAAGSAPDRWARCVGMAVPPSGTMGMSFLTFDQLKRSWYMFLFQSPLAEMAVAQDDLAFIERLWRDWSPGHDPSEDLPAVKDALREPDRLTAALGYYRATIGQGPTSDELAVEQAATGDVPPQPTLYLHGIDDGCMGIEVARTASAAFDRDGCRYEEVADAGHFLHLERPDHVNALIVEHLS